MLKLQLELPRLIASININNPGANRASLWRAIRVSYRQAQDICVQNPLTCGILTSVAMTFLAPLIAPSRS